MRQQTLADWRTPYPVGKAYRIVVCATGAKVVGKGKRRRVERTSYAYIAWQEDTTHDPAREGYGTFCFAGLHRVRHRAMRELGLPEVHQVQVRTNQDRTVYLWNKHADGRITGYRPDGD